MTPLEAYNRTYKLVQSIYTSRLKIQILLSLSDGTKSLADLREVTGSTSQALIPKIRGLERLSLIESGERGYVLTPLGKVVTTKIEDFIVTVTEIHQHQAFWISHDVSGIPAPFMDQIGQLLTSEVKFDTTTDILHVYTNFLKILREAAYVRGISSMMSPQLAEAISQRVADGIPIDLIVSQSIISQLTQEPYLSQIRTLTSFSNFHVWVTGDPLGIAVTVTDKYVSLGLNTKDGKFYDGSTDLNSNDSRAIDWGSRLFEYYRARSTLLTI
jgi:predicted transcriptional regulator